MGTTRAAIYCRISNDQEGRELGVRRQEDDCRARAEREGWDIVRLHVDNDISASTRSKKRRPEFEEMMAAVDRGELDVILAYSNSRFTRRMKELDRLIDAHEKTGVRFCTIVSGDDDLATADGRMVARIKASVDAAEAERISERVTRASRQRAESGEWHGGPSPYGYKPASERGQLEIVPEQAAIVREVATRLLAGETLYGVVTDLNRRGIKPSTGKQWGSRTLKRGLMTTALVGMNAAGNQGNWPAILDRETWDQLRQLLTAPERYKQGTTNGYTNMGARKFALSGLIKCDICERNMVANPYNGKPSFMCVDPSGEKGTKIRIGYDDLETFVVRQVMARIDSPELIRELNDRKTELAEAAELRKSLTADEVRLGQIGDDYDDGVIDRAEWLRRRARVEARLESARQQLADLQTRSVLSNVPTGEEAHRLWEERDTIWRRSFLAALIEKVVVKPLPKGMSSRPQPDTWEKRSEIVAARTEIHWRV